ncbi:hypothetical protein MFLO_13463 [Listeria floridensis FSL S10-1187]|uniref:Uncharacterized protein n=1 Tax=Listeria floridensis FSL S10-1187 TaxID=1265817 RepID=A0ABN0RCQ7_9LIST|nr:hypothetical protein [Listeria floridensis]EUJ27468.1 hypothetical protein MFLO_13463 [Listeria floridensis FSL S10-1187]
MKILAKKITVDTAKNEWMIAIPKETVFDEFFYFFIKKMTMILYIQQSNIPLPSKKKQTFIKLWCRKI